MDVFERARKYQARRKAETQFPPEYFTLREQDQKYGQGLTYMAVSDPQQPLASEDPDGTSQGFFTHSTDPQNVGWTFSPQGSALRPGRKLDLRAQYTQIYMQGLLGGRLQFNPLCAIMPSTAASPYTALVEVPPLDLLSKLRDMRSALGA